MTALSFPTMDDWPANASVLGGSFAGQILHALNDPVMIMYTGWYVDSLKEGPVWHRWLHKQKKEARTPRMGIAVISALYGLIARRIIEIDSAMVERSILFKPGTNEVGVQDGVLERTIAGAVRDSGRLPISRLVEDLVPVKLSRKGQEEWLRDKGIQLSVLEPDPADLLAGLHLAGLLVRLEAAVDLLEPAREALEDVLFDIEMAVYDRVSLSR